MSSKNDFDLELLFSFVEAQINDAKNNGDEIGLNYLEEVRLNLIVAIGETFFHLEWKMPDQGRELLMKFGKMIYQTKSDVITFNYDCLPEWAIERNSDRSMINKQGAPFFNWDRYSAYGIRFTKIRDGGWLSYYDAQSGPNIATKFYEKYYNSSPEIKFIKLHGSYNWFKYSNFVIDKDYKKFEELARSGKLYIKAKKIPRSLEKEIMCFNGDWQFCFLPKWSRNINRTGYPNVLEPIIIPPMLFKDHELKKDIFQQLWRQAKDSLLKCDEIFLLAIRFLI